MAFNDFLDKVKETSSNAMDKAKDTTKRLATVNDLKSKIRGYNNDKNKLFTQMGMDLYIAKKQEEDIEETIDAFVSQIDTINIRIKNLQEKLALVESEE
ncbi:MAG: hypothetical protein HFJ06_02385 [Lachnospiraceae bacterium]|nr:hypothetical protein [Lachnospiraceae bacterium]